MAGWQRDRWSRELAPQGSVTFLAPSGVGWELWGKGSSCPPPPTLQGGFLPLHPPAAQNSCSSSCWLSEVAQNLPKPRELVGTPPHFPLTSHGARPAAGMFMGKPPK